MKRLFSLYIDSYKNLQRNVWILALAMFINRSGSMVLLFTSLYLTRDLNFSISDAGIVMGCYGIGSILGSYAGGWLTDRYHYYPVMLAALFTSGSILLLMLIAESMLTISLIVFFYAFTADIFRPANASAIATFSTAENRTRSVSLMRMAMNLGFSLGPAAGGFIALHLGYKWLFALDASCSFGAAIMLIAYLPSQKKHNKEDTSVSKPKSKSAYKDYTYLFFIFLVAIYGTCFFQLFASMPQYFNKVCGLQEDTIGLLLALNGFLVVLIEMPLIAKIEKTKRIFSYIIAGVICIPVSFMFVLAGNCILIWAVIYTLFITLSEILAMPFMMNVALSRPAIDRQGQYAALYSIAYGLANTAAPTLGLGIAGKHGFNTMLWFFIALSGCTAIGMNYVRKRM